MDETAAARATADLIALFDVAEQGPDLFHGPRKPGGVGRMFGGQVVAQALAAAQRTVEAVREPHSLHAYFLRGGSEDHHVAYQVERDFDGGTFSNRRVIARQLGRPIFSLTASFQAREPGPEHQDAMPDVPPPEALEDEAVLALRPGPIRTQGIQARQRFAPAIEIRPVTRPLHPETGLPAPVCNWLRVKSDLGQDPALHRLVLAYMSDLLLFDTAVSPHLAEAGDMRITAASLDHAIWFHDDFRADEWILHAAHSPWADRARGFTHGQIYRRDGRLAASIAQEGLMRMTPK